MGLFGGPSLTAGRRSILVPLAVVVAIIFLLIVVVPSHGQDASSSSKTSYLDRLPVLSNGKPATKTVTAYRDCPTDSPLSDSYSTSKSAEAFNVKLGPFLMHNDGSVVPAKHREPDTLDAFAEYRGRDKVPLSSLDLHQPFEPLCSSLPEVLNAMSNGGRIGQDAPYHPRGCDMRWYTTDEICEILSRFSHVWVVGDSLIRHTSSAFHVFLRADLFEGGWAKWHAKDDFDCRGAAAFGNGGCLFAEAWSSLGVWDHEPASMKCPRSAGLMEFVMANKYPLDPRTFDGTLDRIREASTDKPHAFILGQGLWNDLKEEDSHNWFGEFEAALDKVAKDVPSIKDSPKIFMTPSAGGVGKPEKFQAFQSNIQLARFELNMKPWVQKKGYWHLGTWNATIQNSSPDGTHSGMNADLLKAMMLFNWLDWVGRAIEKDGKAPVPSV